VPGSSLPGGSAVPAPTGVSFAPGACVRFSPVRGNRHQVVLVDPGHGGPDTGALGATTAGRQVTEAHLSLAIGKALLGRLRAEGFAVVMSRTGNGAVTRVRPSDAPGGIFTAAGLHRDLLARVACANAAHAGVLLSIHLNAFSDPTAGGSETIYDAVRPFAAGNLRLARLVQRDVVTSLAAGGWRVPNRGVLDDRGQGTAVGAAAAAYGHLLLLGPRSATHNPSPSQMPGALSEPLFITNPSEADIAESRAGQAAVARGLAAAVTSFTAPAGTAAAAASGKTSTAGTAPGAAAPTTTKPGAAPGAKAAAPAANTTAPPTPATRHPAPATTTAPALPIPASLPLLAAPAMPGEGQWHPAGDRLAGGYVVYTTVLRPAAGQPPAGVAWIDSPATRLALYAGTAEPSGSWPDQGSVAPAQQPSLIAAFDSGFKIYVYGTGWWYQGRAAEPLRAGMASLVVFTNGTATVGDWGRDVGPGPGILAVRQNLPLLVDHGAPVASAASPGLWGAVLGGGVHTWRSGVGVTAGGDLVYVGGPGLAPADLARLLVAAGAVRAMELDINPEWVSFATFTHTGGIGGSGVTGTNLVPGMYYGPSHYLQPYSRDFFAVFAR
ncbi:MAG: N-acetylmuramoyl-L-alanine amidase, partial [Acidimicrobiales bacterium]